MSEPCDDLRHLRVDDLILFRSGDAWLPARITSVSGGDDGMVVTLMLVGLTGGYRIHTPLGRPPVGYGHNVRLPTPEELLVGAACVGGRDVILGG